MPARTHYLQRSKSRGDQVILAGLHHSYSYPVRHASQSSLRRHIARTCGRHQSAARLRKSTPDRSNAMRKGLDAGTDSARIHPKNAWTIMGIACQRGERHDPRPYGAFTEWLRSRVTERTLSRSQQTFSNDRVHEETVV